MIPALEAQAAAARSTPVYGCVVSNRNRVLYPTTQVSDSSSAPSGWGSMSWTPDDEDGEDEGDEDSLGPATQPPWRDDNDDGDDRELSPA